MKAIYRKRLLKLIIHLERGKLGHPVFDFSCWNAGKKVNGCRTNGCAVGELPVLFPRLWKFRGSYFDDPILQCAADFFDVSLQSATQIFTPEGSGLPYKARRKTVAKHLRKFLNYEPRTASN
jgi:hypothetical protein